MGKGVAAIGESRGVETGDAAVGEMAELIGADVVKLLRTSYNREAQEQLLLAVYTRVNSVVEWEIRRGDLGSGVVRGRVHTGPVRCVTV